MKKLNVTLLIGNPLMKWLLRSPWHTVASQEVMLITFTGRKTGKRYTTPVNYVQDGEVLSVLSHARRTWWRNLRGGAPVTIVLRGKRIETIGTAYEKAEDVEELFLQHLKMAPKYATIFSVEMDSEGQPVPAAAAAAAAGKVMIEIELPEEEVAAVE
ncbi:MAG: nitroreductase family deazaflavin-dependent oxidoreductase [Caldilineaceae bacterium]|nr:nitroreductase family deazaflavin-dependent oxidoreductase [Caldilineaceae bacterium]